MRTEIEKHIIAENAAGEHSLDIIVGLSRAIAPYIDADGLDYDDLVDITIQAFPDYADNDTCLCSLLYEANGLGWRLADLYRTAKFASREDEEELALMLMELTIVLSAMAKLRTTAPDLPEIWKVN